MPTVFSFNGYRFFFFAADEGDPLHIHVEKDDCYCKIWLKPINLANNNGFRPHELKIIIKILSSRTDLIEGKWHEFFSR